MAWFLPIIFCAVTTLNAEQLSKEAELNCERARGYYHQGLNFKKENNLEAALQAFSTAIESCPTYEQVYRDRGLARYELKDYRGAIADFTKAISLISQELDVLYHYRGGSYLANGDYAEAVTDYDRAIRMRAFPHGLYYFNRAIAWEGLKNYPKALEDYARGLKIEPSDQYFHRRALLNLKLGKYREALKDYDDAIAMVEGHRELQKKFEGTSIVSSYKIDLNQLAIYYLKRGIIKTKLKRKQEALEDFYKSKDLGEPEAIKQIEKAGKL